MIHLPIGTPVTFDYGFGDRKKAMRGKIKMVLPGMKDVSGPKYVIDIGKGKTVQIPVELVKPVTANLSSNTQGNSMSIKSLKRLKAISTFTKKETAGPFGSSKKNSTFSYKGYTINAVYRTQDRDYMTEFTTPDGKIYTGINVYDDVEGAIHEACIVIGKKLNIKAKDMMTKLTPVS